MSQSPATATVEAWARLVRAEQLLLDRVESDLKSQGFPPLAWYDVLYELDRSADGWLLQAEVQSRVLLAQYNLCRLVDRLEREGLVERRQCPEDGRSNVLHITDKGRSLRAGMWPAYAASIECHLGRHLSAEDAATLARLLGKLVAPPATPEPPL